MPLTITELQDDIRDALGVDSDDLDNTKVNRLINRSWLEIQNNFNLRQKDGIFTINTAAGVFQYDLAADHDSFERVTVRDPISLVETPLDRNNVDEFAENYTSDTDERSNPITYTPRLAQKIWLNPVPDKAYVITVYYKSILPDITSTIDPQKLYDIILYGAIWRGFFQDGNHNRGMTAKSFQSALIKDHRPQEDKDEKDSRMAGVEVIIEENY